MAPVQSSSDVQPEKVATAAPVLTNSLPSPINVQPEARYERKMGDTELSYYLPSRASGVNDMYVPSVSLAILNSLFSAQVSAPRFQGARPHDGPRKSARRLGHPPSKTSVARSGCRDARLRRCSICVREEMPIGNIRLTPHLSCVIGTSLQLPQMPLSNQPTQIWNTGPKQRIVSLFLTEPPPFI